MKTNTFEITLTFTEPLLGSTPKDKEIYASYIAGKANLTDEQLAEELESVDHVEEAGWTGFHHNGDGPIIYDYVIKGFFKDACGMLRRASGSLSAKLRAYKKVIDGLVFVSPRQIPLALSGELGVLERPLRAQTAQGERVALARSDTAPPDTTLTFQVECLGGDVNEELLREWFDYGQKRGLGQWRNASYGRFVYEMRQVE